MGSQSDSRIRFGTRWRDTRIYFRLAPSSTSHGTVYGDIGTSVLYCIMGNHSRGGVAEASSLRRDCSATEGYWGATFSAVRTTLGSLSWSFGHSFFLTVKYDLMIMRADSSWRRGNVCSVGASERVHRQVAPSPLSVFSLRALRRSWPLMESLRHQSACWVLLSLWGKPTQ